MWESDVRAAEEKEQRRRDSKPSNEEQEDDKEKVKLEVLSLVAKCPKP